MAPELGDPVIQVNIELWPFGRPENIRLIDVVQIGNIGPGYDTTVADLARYLVVHDDTVLTVEHDRSKGALPLVAQALVAVINRESTWSSSITLGRRGAAQGPRSRQRRRRPAVETPSA